MLLKKKQKIGNKRDNTENPLLKETYDLNREKAEFVADKIQTELLDRKPTHSVNEKAIQTETDSNPKVGFEKYKDFVKKNFIGLSGLLITIGGVIATIVFAIRSGAKSAGNSTQKAGNDDVKKSFGGILGKIIGENIQNLGKIISWFGDHLMVLIGLIVGVSVL